MKKYVCNICLTDLTRLKTRPPTDIACPTCGMRYFPIETEKD